MDAIEKELKKHEAIRARGAEIGRKLMESKRQMQEEAQREYKENPEIRAVFEKLYSEVENEAK